MHLILAKKLLPWVLVALAAVVFLITAGTGGMVSRSAVAMQVLAANAEDPSPQGAAPRAVVAAERPDGSNGRIDLAGLCKPAVAPAGTTQGLVTCEAAAAFDAMAQAYAADMGKQICWGNGYRSLAEQIILQAIKPSLAAKAGHSNHGWGLAVDLCGGIERFGTAEHRWMQVNAGRFGWVHPDWAQHGGSRPEAWHWEYGAQ